MTRISVLWTITWGSWLTALAIVLVRLLLGKVLSPKAKYYLWLLLALRLLLPVLPQSSFSVQNALPQRSATVSVLPADTPAAPAAAIMDTTQAAEAPMLEPDSPAVSAAPTPAPVSRSLSPSTALLILYGIGAGITACVYLALYVRTARMLKRLPDCNDAETLAVWDSLRSRLSLSKRIVLKRGSQGMSGGLIHPTIVLPLEVTGSDAMPILLHEAQHIAAHDLWIMTLYRLLRCVYWFNPVVWLCFRQAFFDSEGACDQRVLESGLVSGADYAQALYRESLLAASDGLYLRTAFGGKHAIRRRIAQITRFHGKKLWMAPLALALGLIVSACTLTARNAQSDSPASEQGVSEVSAASESGSAIPTSDLETSDISTPMFLTDGDLTFLNLPWGSTPEFVMDDMNYTDEDFTLTSRGRNFEADVSLSPPDHPEIGKVKYEFHFVGLDLTKGLDYIEIFYDDDQVSYDDLHAACTELLGTPEHQDDKSANWTAGSTYVTLSNLNFLKLTLVSAAREVDYADSLSTSEGIASYMDTLMPPNGHYGWTYQQHIDAGLLNPDTGVFTQENENTDSFTTTITLGDEEVEARYYFVRNLPLQGTDTHILTEVHVTPPENIPFRDWFARFSDQYTDKLYENQRGEYRTPVTVGNLLTQEQKEEIGNLALQYTGQYASTEAWSLSLIWQDGGLLKFNGTGYALYLALTGQVTN